MPMPMPMPTIPRFSSTLAPLVPLIIALSLSGGCGSDTKTGAVGAATVGLAVLNSDYSVTSVSLYDPVSQKLVDGCVHTDATLAQPLSGDVTLPSQTVPQNELVVIDRMNSVLSFVAPATCMPRGQLSVSTGGLKANPRDVISVSAHKSYVTRYETNPSPTDDPTDFDEGDDVLVIDPLAIGPSQKPILNRIGLSTYATTVPGTIIQARPDRGVLANGKVYVTLGNLSADFVPGAGRVVEIDPATDTVTDVIDLPGQKECSAIEYVSASNRLYVSCWGSLNDADQAATSALVEIDLSGAKPVLGRSVAASALGNLPINFSSVGVIGEIAFIGTLGVQDFTTKELIAPDSFYAVDLGTQIVTKLLDATGAYNFGRVAVDAAHKRVYLPDGDAVTPRVHVFDASGAAVVSAGVFEANPAAHLPPREAAWY